MHAPNRHKMEELDGEHGKDGRDVDGNLEIQALLPPLGRPPARLVDSVPPLNTDRRLDPDLLLTLAQAVAAYADNLRGRAKADRTFGRQ